MAYPDPPRTPWLMVGSGYQMTPGPCHGARLVETLPDRDVSVLTGGLPGVQELGRWSLQLPEIQVLNGETNEYQWGYHSIKMSLSFHKKWVDGHNCDGPPEVSELPVCVSRVRGLAHHQMTRWPKTSWRWCGGWTWYIMIMIRMRSWLWFLDQFRTNWWYVCLIWNDDPHLWHIQ